MSWIVDGFLRLQFDEFMPLPVPGFSWVYKPTSWFVLHFIHERGVYLVLVTQRQQASTICLLPWGWPSSVTPFFYIKPQRGDKTTIQPKVVLYRFSTSNHNHGVPNSIFFVLYYIVSLHQTTTIGFTSAAILCCIISFLYIKPQLQECHEYWRFVVLYRFSTSNHSRNKW